MAKAYEWFGYKFHLLVDIRHEVILAFKVTSAAGEGTGDSSVLPVLLEKAQGVLSEGRIQTLAFDKAADDEKTHALLNEEGIKPVIEVRALWKEEPERMLPGHDGDSNVVYDEAGTIYCYDKVSKIPVKHKMSYIGYEKQRGTLKYRCPARHEDFPCPATRSAMVAVHMARRCVSGANWTCGGSRPFPGPPRSSSGVTTAGRRWSG